MSSPVCEFCSSDDLLGNDESGWFCVSCHMRWDAADLPRDDGLLDRPDFNRNAPAPELPRQPTVLELLERPEASIRCPFCFTLVMSCGVKPPAERCCPLCNCGNREDPTVASGSPRVVDEEGRVHERYP